MYKMFFSSYIFFMLYLLIFLGGIFIYFSELVYFMEWNIFFFNSVNFNFIVLIDYLSLIFISVVFLISSMVIIYSIEYMFNEKNLERFMYLLILFIISMLFMILSPNLMSILLGWDGLGLISYCLVIFYQQYSSFNSGMITILMNRIGDIGLLMSICMVFGCGSWNMFLYSDFMNLMMLMLILSAITKSAQIPFSVWLPAAMAAPTPISSLVHSSTLVTAGVYLMIRYNEMLMMSMWSELLLLLSSLTMLIAGLSANFEFDLKKIIALSTLSQLGLMMSILSLGFVQLAFFHLLMHALFKSLLFLCAGCLIHCLGDNQDIRYYGGMAKILPFLSLSFFFSNLSLCGFPFFSGFYSKDYIMEMFFMTKMNYLSFLMLILGTIMTVSYTFRMILYLYFNEMNFFSLNYISENNLMNYSMLFLLSFSILSGYYMYNMIFYIKFIFLSKLMKLLVIILMVIGLFLGILMFFYGNKFKLIGFMLFNFLWLTNYFKNNYINVFMLSSMMDLLVEKGWLEYMNRMWIMSYPMYFIKLKVKMINVFDLFKFMLIMYLVVLIFW